MCVCVCVRVCEEVGVVRAFGATDSNHKHASVPSCVAVHSHTRTHTHTHRHTHTHTRTDLQRMQSVHLVGVSKRPMSKCQQWPRFGVDALLASSVVPSGADVAAEPPYFRDVTASCGGRRCSAAPSRTTTRRRSAQRPSSPTRNAPRGATSSSPR